MAASRSSTPLRRLDQLLSACGYCSRPEAKAWVRAGRAPAGGEEVRRSDEKVAACDVLIDGEPVECPDGLLAVFHKPLGCVCSRDERESRSVFDLLLARWSQQNPPVSSVGRLDRDTTGLLLIADKGDLLHRLTSPKHKVPKVYEVTFGGRVPAGLVELSAAGTLLLEGESEPCLPARLLLLGDGQARLEVTEGRFHQVRRMFSSQGLLATALHRSRFGEFTLDGLAPGEWRLLPLPARRGKAHLFIVAGRLAARCRRPRLKAERQLRPTGVRLRCWAAVRRHLHHLIRRRSHDEMMRPLSQGRRQRPNAASASNRAGLSARWRTSSPDRRNPNPTP